MCVRAQFTAKYVVGVHVVAVDVLFFTDMRAQEGETFIPVVAVVVVVVVVVQSCPDLEPVNISGFFAFEVSHFPQSVWWWWWWRRCVRVYVVV